jgi:hypothetical protein
MYRTAHAYNAGSMPSAAASAAKRMANWQRLLPLFRAKYLESISFSVMVVPPSIWRIYQEYTSFYHFSGVKGQAANHFDGKAISGDVKSFVCYDVRRGGALLSAHHSKQMMRNSRSSIS